MCCGCSGCWNAAGRHRHRNRDGRRALFSRVLASQLYGITPTDPLTFASAIGFLGAIALLALLVPARGATRVPPMNALRPECRTDAREAPRGTIRRGPTACVSWPPGGSSAAGVAYGCQSGSHHARSSSSSVRAVLRSAESDPSRKRPRFLSSVRRAPSVSPCRCWRRPRSTAARSCNPAAF